VTPRQFAILCILAVTWGCSFLFIKVIIDAGVEPMGMSGFRTALGAATLLPFAWRARAGFRPVAAGSGLAARPRTWSRRSDRLTSP